MYLGISPCTQCQMNHVQYCGSIALQGHLFAIVVVVVVVVVVVLVVVVVVVVSAAVCVVDHH